MVGTQIAVGGVYGPLMKSGTVDTFVNTATSALTTSRFVMQKPPAIVISSGSRKSIVEGVG